MKDPGASSSGGWTRVKLGVQALLAIGLALGAAALAVDVSDWRYWRVDLSLAGRNSLDPAILDVLDKLPEPAVVDVFFRPLAYPFTPVSQEAQERTLELLFVAQNSRRDRFELRRHDPARFEEMRERQRELGIEGDNLVVVSCGGRKAVLELFGELCLIDWGNPTREGVGYLIGQGIPSPVNARTWQSDSSAYRPPQFQEFRGEEVLAQALLKVSSGSAPRVVFAKGHGEPDLSGAAQMELASLRAALARDGFEVSEWDVLREPAVPDDCAVLALIGARQPYQEATRAAIRAYAEGGGRMLLAPDLSELEQDTEGGIVSVLRDFGIETRPGVVCQALAGFGGEKVEGVPDCAVLVIDEGGLQASHALTEPLRRRGRRVQFRFSPAFESLGGSSAGAGIMLPLVSTPRESWRDRLDSHGQYDYRCNPAQGEGRDRQYLVVTKDLRASKDAETGAVRQGRILGVASAFFFGNIDFATNRDFALNAFNWLAEREYRLSVSPLNRSLSYLDLERGSARPVLIYSLWLGLPGLCALIGGLVFLRRRS